MTGFSLNGKAFLLNFLPQITTLFPQLPSMWDILLDSISLSPTSITKSFPFYSLFIGYINLSSVTPVSLLRLELSFFKPSNGSYCLHSAPSQSILRIGRDHFKCKCNFLSVLPSPKDWNPNLSAWCTKSLMIWFMFSFTSTFRPHLTTCTLSNSPDILLTPSLCRNSSLCLEFLNCSFPASLPG